MLSRGRRSGQRAHDRHAGGNRGPGVLRCRTKFWSAEPCAGIRVLFLSAIESSTDAVFPPLFRFFWGAEAAMPPAETAFAPAGTATGHSNLSNLDGTGVFREQPDRRRHAIRTAAALDGLHNLAAVGKETEFAARETIFEQGAPITFTSSRAGMRNSSAFFRMAAAACTASRFRATISAWP